MILMIDNYDSFTYNVYQVFANLNYTVKVVRNDAITIEEIEELNPTHIVISPGPGTPHEAGISIKVIEHFKGKIPILGICLGHQAILASFGVPIVNASRIVHGKVEPVNHTGEGLFRNIPQRTSVTRYHSLAGKEKDIPDCFTISAKTDDGEVMGVEHKEFILCGVQFHPESVGTKDGVKMIKNFLNYRRGIVKVKDHLKNLVSKIGLSFKDASDIMDELTEGDMDPSQIGSLLTALEIKGVTSSELAGFASTLRKKAGSFARPILDEKRLDTCGTGGAPSGKTFNVSTTAAIICASAGANIVKHGNRSVTSRSGSADLLESFGVNIEMSPDTAYDIYKKTKFTFLYARKFHQALRFATPVRSALGFRTVFNLVGPLANPADATHQIIGVFDEQYTIRMAEALGQLGTRRAMIVHGFDGIDEISLTSPTRITELNEGWIKTYDFDPTEIGLKYSSFDQLKGGDSADNKIITTDILSGVKSARSDLACLNAGAALYIYGLADSIRGGYELALDTIKNKNPLSTLSKLVELSRGCEVV